MILWLISYRLGLGGPPRMGVGQGTPDTQTQTHTHTDISTYCENQLVQTLLPSKLQKHDGLEGSVR